MSPLRKAVHMVEPTDAGPEGWWVAIYLAPSAAFPARYWGPTCFRALLRAARGRRAYIRALVKARLRS